MNRITDLERQVAKMQEHEVAEMLHMLKTQTAAVTFTFIKGAGVSSLTLNQGQADVKLIGEAAEPIVKQAIEGFSQKAEQAEYEKYLELKQKFEPKNK